MKRIISLLLALLLSLSAVCCAAAESVTFKTAYFTLTLPKDWAVDYEDAGVDEDGGEYLGCFVSTEKVGLLAIAYMVYYEDLKDVTLWNSDESELQAYVEVWLEEYEDCYSEYLGILMAGRIPFLLLKGTDEYGEFLHAETMTTGHVIAFRVILLDEKGEQCSLNDKYIEQFKAILDTFQPI